MSDLVIELSPDLERRLTEAARREGLLLPDYVRNALDALVPSSDVPADRDPVAVATAALSSTKPIWARVADAGAAVPAEEQQRLPVDGAENLDHYLYGAPKRQ